MEEEEEERDQLLSGRCRGSESVTTSVNPPTPPRFLSQIGHDITLCWRCIVALVRHNCIVSSPTFCYNEILS